MLIGEAEEMEAFGTLDAICDKAKAKRPVNCNYYENIIQEN